LFALQLLEENPKSCDALLGRGTAYAFLRNLEIAITDFSKVQMPSLNFFFSNALHLCWNALKLLFHKEAVATVANR
jgi:hypothetical protein